MALYCVLSPPLSRLLCHHHRFGKSPLFIRWSSSHLSIQSMCLSFSSCVSAHGSHAKRASCSKQQGELSAHESSSLLDEDLLRRLSGAKDAEQALEIIAEAKGSAGGVVEPAECHLVIGAAFERGNADLALSLFHAMNSGTGRGMIQKASSIERWSWAKPDGRTYGLMVRGLAAALRVSDAIRMISYVSRMGVSSGEEVPFGTIVRCPSCVVSYKSIGFRLHRVPSAGTSMSLYLETLLALIQKKSGCNPPERSMDISAWEKALRLLQINRDSIPAALHSIVVCTPSGSARTHKFATKTVELPAQEGERVTMCLAAPPSLYRAIGPVRLTAQPPGFNPGEPMCLTNHETGQVSQLLKAPAKSGNSFLLSPYILLPSLALLASGDAVAPFFDPTIPRLISVAAAASVIMGTAVNRLVLPEMRKIPQKVVDIVALRQQLLSQYDQLQNRIKDLRQAAEREIWMLARMCQLENKIVAVGEPSYRARRSKVKRVRENLENALLARIELIESYAKISSMIEIEVEMDSDVLAAEAVNNAESIAEQIQQIMEIENLEERWRIQAEANDEVERLLSSQGGIPTELT